jgi:hypothetical protein
MQLRSFVVAGLMLGLLALAGCGGPDELAESESAARGGPGGGGRSSDDVCKANEDRCPSSGFECCDSNWCWCQDVCFADPSCPGSLLCYDDFGYYCADSDKGHMRAGGICSVPSCRPR